MTTNANTGPSREAVAEAVQRLQAELTANAAAFGAILAEEPLEELPVRPAVDNPCQCESIHHELPDAAEPDAGTGHGYMAVPAGARRAQWVGAVCDECADTHLASYLIPTTPQEN